MKIHNLVKHVALIAMSCFFVLSNPALANKSMDTDITRVIKVGSTDEVVLLKKLYEEYPDSRSKLDEIRKEIAALPYDTEVKIHIQVRNGKSDINWQEVAAGAAVGLGLTLFWNAFGGELLCFAGFVPACACVGPQC